MAASIEGIEGIIPATAHYEAWLARRTATQPDDFRHKHGLMASGLFPFFRGTYYRWAQRWPQICPDEHDAPIVTAIADVHAENFGTWRDAEGRLVWGINDVDEAYPLPYTNDLARLAASVIAAAEERWLRVGAKAACRAILAGYRAGLNKPRPFVLRQAHPELTALIDAINRDTGRYWKRLSKLPLVKQPLPASARQVLRSTWPEKSLPRDLRHRLAGLGSLGRVRWVALADVNGGWIAREIKAVAPSACAWAAPSGKAAVYYGGPLLHAGTRSPDPYFRMTSKWLVRRIAPEAAKIDLADLPRDGDMLIMLEAMGAEIANFHSGSPRALAAIHADLSRRSEVWLRDSANAMLAALHTDWREWRKANR